MMSMECNECGEDVPLLARACPRCGAPNPARLGTIAVVVGLVALVGALGGAIYVATQPTSAPPATASNSAPPATAGNPATTAPATPAAPPPPAQAAGTGGDFTWLKSAMAACDAAAMRQPGAVYFMVIPLLADAKDMPDWRLIAVGAIGNGLTIPGNDALGGLRNGRLKIYADDYAFGIQDIATKLAYNWTNLTGPKQLSTADGIKATSFRMQVLPRRKSDVSDWGDTYPRQSGTCHWVAAILRI